MWCRGYVLNDGSGLAETYRERGNALLGSEQGLNNLDRDNDRRRHQRRREGPKLSRWIGASSVELTAQDDRGTASRAATDPGENPLNRANNSRYRRPQFLRFRRRSRLPLIAWRLGCRGADSLVCSDRNTTDELQHNRDLPRDTHSNNSCPHSRFDAAVVPQSRIGYDAVQLSMVRGMKSAPAASSSCVRRY